LAGTSAPTSIDIVTEVSASPISQRRFDRLEPCAEYFVRRRTGLVFQAQFGRHGEQRASLVRGGQVPFLELAIDKCVQWPVLAEQHFTMCIQLSGRRLQGRF